MIHTNRRQFIKITSLAAGGLMASSGYQWASASQSYYDRYGQKKLPTYCEVCFWKCAAWVHFDRNGEIWKIKGNEEDPLCEGRLCPRGSAGLGMYNDPDRLKTPLIRTEKDGVQYYKQVSWPQAIDHIARKMRIIMEESGPESLALFNHGSGGKHFSKLFNICSAN